MCSHWELLQNGMLSAKGIVERFLQDQLPSHPRVLPVQLTLAVASEDHI